MRNIILGILALILTTTIAKADILAIVSISQQKMYVETEFENYVFPVSTGRKGYKTPTGIFTPYYMTTMHYSKKYENAPMPYSVFFNQGIATHATPYIKNLGKPASHGCVRLHPFDAELFYNLVKKHGMKNTTIIIED